MRGGDADGVSGDLVVADRHDSTSRAAVYKIQHEEQRNEDEHNARGEGGDLGDAGYADRAVDDHLAAVAQLEILVDQAEMQTGIIQTKIHNVYKVFDDLTEGEGYDGEVVALEAQYRHADDDTRNRRKQSGNDHSDSQTQRCKRNRIRQTGGGDNARKRADRHKARMAERQLTEDADGQVERDRHDNIRADRHKQTLDLAGDAAARDGCLHDDVRNNDNAEAQQRVTSALGRSIGF